MQENFDRALDVVLVHEGGYVNHPADPGGATNKGVTQRVYDGYRRLKGLQPRSVRYIGHSELRDIYYRQYWLKVSGDDLPAGVDMIVFDGAVHSGPDRSVRLLQAALGNVKVDGQLGEATLAAVLRHGDHDELVADILRRRLAFLRRLRHWAVFGRGWSARLAGLLKTGQAWAHGSVGPKIVHVAGMEKRADVEQLDEPSEASAAIADASIAGGSATAMLSGAAQQLEPLKESSPVILYLFVTLTIAGVLLTAVGLGLRYMRNRKAARARQARASESIADLAPLEAFEFAEAA